ncbi:MAG: LysE family transporter [Bacteroidota bacterium]
MIDAAIQGIVLGLALSVLIGPVFFLLIQTSIKEGFKAALKLELGIISSDAFCIFVSYLGLARVLENPTVANYVGLGGGIMLLVIGVKTYFSHKTVKEEEIEIKKTSGYKLFFRGFLLNTGNPSVILFWLGAVGIAVAQFGTSKLNIGAYFIATLGTYFAFDVLKAYLAQKVKKFLTPKSFDLINKIAGVVIFGFGIVLLFKVILNFYSK